MTQAYLHLVNIVNRFRSARQVPRLIYTQNIALNFLTAKVFSWNFQPLDVVSRWRDPQLQVAENDSDLTKWRSMILIYCCLMSHFILNMYV